MANTKSNFWSKVTVLGPDDCWIWNGSVFVQQKGWKYGCFWWEGKNRRAHRLSYEWEFGKIPEGMVVRHKCDTPLCVNPNHLELGTQKENMKDCKDRGRLVNHKGSLHGNSKLTEAQVIEIRKRLEAGETKTSIAPDYGVTRYAIYWAEKRGWKHV